MSHDVLTVIEWTDSYSPTNGPWVSTEECSAGSDEPLPIVSVGFVFKETAQYVALCASAALSDLNEGLQEADRNVSGIMFIPHTQIRRRVEVDILPKLAKTKAFQWVCEGYAGGQ